MPVSENIKKDLEKVAGLFESPQIVSPTDFDLKNPDKNKELADEILSKAKEIIRETPDYYLVRTGDLNNKGYIAQISKSSGLITYMIKYETSQNKLIGRFVTQVALWRDLLEYGINKGLTTEIFFDYLLPVTGTIISDNEQTANGRDFWLRKLAEAHNNGLKIGFINTTKNVLEWYDSSVSFKNWLLSKNAWGETRNHFYDRFVISNV